MLNCDIIIIGAGTAGLSSAIYSRRAGKSVIIFENTVYGGQIINTPDIENYPGIAHISGYEFAQGLYDQAMSFGCEYKNENVEKVLDNGEYKTVLTSQGNTYTCKAVIIASGAKNRPLGLAKETEFIGRGVSYCATCDGMFFRKKVVCVNGGGNTAVEDADFLSNYCEKVYVVHRRDQFRADEKDVQNLRSKTNVEFILDSKIVELLGDERLSGVKIQNVKTGETFDLDVAGLFIAIGQMPDNERFRNIVDLDDKGYIVAQEDCKTKTFNIYAAGDCRTKEVRQLTTAASDGAVAALEASKHC